VALPYGAGVPTLDASHGTPAVTLIWLNISAGWRSQPRGWLIVMDM